MEFLPDFELEEGKYHTIKEGDRLDLISYKYFGDVKYWKFIAAFNHLIDPLELEVGTLLKIPTFTSVQRMAKKYPKYLSTYNGGNS